MLNKLVPLLCFLSAANPLHRLFPPTNDMKQSLETYIKMEIPIDMMSHVTALKTSIESMSNIENLSFSQEINDLLAVVVRMNGRHDNLKEMLIQLAAFFKAVPNDQESQIKNHLDEMHESTNALINEILKVMEKPIHGLESAISKQHKKLVQKLNQTIGENYDDLQQNIHVVQSNYQALKDEPTLENAAKLLVSVNAMNDSYHLVIASLDKLEKKNETNLQMVILLSILTGFIPYMVFLHAGHGKNADHSNHKKNAEK